MCIGPERHVSFRDRLARFETSEAELASSETKQAGLPVLIGPSRPRPSLRRSETGAAFVSQLLAARANLMPQRERRRDTPEGAIGAYAGGARVGVKRMPAGYRTSIVA